MSELQVPSIVKMSDPEYFGLPYMDQTQLKQFMTSPRAYADYQRRAHDSGAFDFGKAAHSLVLGSGPDVAVKPNLRTKAGKEQAKVLEENAGADGIIFLPEAQYEAVQAMVEHKPTLPDGEPEMALIAQDPASGVILKGKADWLPSERDDDGVYRIRDYKTSSGDLTDFSYACWKYGYHIQAAFYMRLYRLCTGTQLPLGFSFLVQEKTAPYDWVEWRLDENQPEIKEIANPIIDNALKNFAWWVEQGLNLDDMLKWGLDKTPRQVQFKDWQLLDAEEEMSSWQ